jgi:hypothetical protein
MPHARQLGSLSWKLVAAILVAGAFVGLTARADKPETEAAKRPGPKALTKAEIREARDIFKAFQDLATSVHKEKQHAKSQKVDTDALLKSMNRPARTVMPPTLTPQEVDALLDKALTASKTVPARLTSDEEFVRRICLDVAGRLPNPDQVRTFLNNSKKDKRAHLIDFLLDTPEYAQNWARYWRDVVRYHATAEQPRLVNFPKLEEWLTAQFAKNRPWDEIARELIAATGSTEEDGATVFTAAHQGQAVEVAGEVSRVFLGVQIQCAQCHDHPNDPWKREQFHEFAAFFTGVRLERNGKAGMATGLTLTARPGVPKYTMPDLKDPHKSVPVEPKFFLASSETPVPKTLSTQGRRILAASYITGQDNPWFGKAFVNRVWYSLMGDGFYSPVDDLGPTREPRDPEVLEALASQFQQGGYDIKWLLRTVLNTQAYQREFRASTSAAGKVPFAANCPSRLRADQIFDALQQAIGFNLPGNGPANRQERKEEKKQEKAAAKKAPLGMGPNAGPRGAFNLLFGVDPSVPTDDVLGTIPQALFLMNSPPINRAIRADKGTVLGEILAATPNNREALEMLYLRVLARRPTTKEIDVLERYADKVGDRKEVFEDILWSLINSTEFISRR